jgi:hypothetical protein
MKSMLQTITHEIHAPGIVDCGYCEKSIRLHFEKLFDFVSFNAALISKS